MGDALYSWIEIERKKLYCFLDIAIDSEHEFMKYTHVRENFETRSWRGYLVSVQNPRKSSAILSAERTCRLHKVFSDTNPGLGKQQKM
jgi:hypothetical protein